MSAKPKIAPLVLQAAHRTASMARARAFNHHATARQWHPNDTTEGLFEHETDLPMWLVGAG